MQITVSGTAFTSYDVKVNNRTKNEIKKENTTFEEVLKTNQNEKLSYQTTNNLTNESSKVVFTDPTNGKLVLVSLENSTIDKLRDKYGIENIYKKEDGTLRLNGEVEAFVSGWFADIAYNREFLKADENNDGILEEKEYLSTYNSFSITGEDFITNNDFFTHEEVNEKLGYGMDKIDETIYRTRVHVKSLDDELNYTINIDKDFNGKVSLKEAYEGESTIEEKVRKNIEEFYSNSNNIKDLPFSQFLNEVINLVLDTLKEPKKDKDGNIEIDRARWESLKIKHNIQIDETLQSFLEKTKENK